MQTQAPEEELDGPIDSQVDGRTARRDRNRDAVLDAVIELFTEDSLVPGAAEVAKRSGVSPRSVYRYFEDIDDLIRAATDRHFESIRPLFIIKGIGQGPLDGRTETIVSLRLHLFEVIASTMRASLALARSNELMRERMTRDRQLLRQQIELQFAPELDAMSTIAARDVTAAVDVLLGFESIEHLRHHRELPGPAARRVLVRAVAAMFATTD
jgi:AcrR family transcriptional regulator